MVYQIRYKKDKEDQCLYDIDIWLKPRENTVKCNEWQTDLCNCTFTDGIAKYVYDNIHDEDTLKKFMEDGHKMDEIRGFLHEQHRNYWLPQDEAHEKMHNELLPDLINYMKDFVNKWPYLKLC